MLVMSQRLLALVIIGIASGAYLPPPTSRQLPFPSLNSETSVAPGGTRGFNGRGRLPGGAAQGDAYGGRLTGSGTSVAAVGTGGTGFGGPASVRSGFGGAGAAGIGFGGAGTAGIGFGGAGTVGIGFGGARGRGDRIRGAGLRTYGTPREDLVSASSEAIAVLGSAIGGGGVAGEDYPILSSVPNTGFSCDDQLPGYYADTADDAGCQVFHICQLGGRMDSFLCPNGTVFNQQYFVCDWWYNFDCSTAEQYYELNTLIGQVDATIPGAGAFNGDGFGSTSTTQGAYSPFGSQNVAGGSPFSGSGVAGGVQGGGFSNGRGNIEVGARFGSASGQQGSFAGQPGGVAPSQSYGLPGSSGGNFGAGSNFVDVLTGSNGNTRTGQRIGGFNSGGPSTPSRLYGVAGK